MKKMALMAVSLMVCLYLAGCGSPDRNRQGREQLTAQTQAADMAQAAGMEQGSSGQIDEEHLTVKDTSVLQDISKEPKNREDWKETSGGNYNPDYTVNEDGTYTFDGETFQYKMLLSNSKRGGGYLILTNNENLTYDDVFGDRISSYFVDSDLANRTKYVMLGLLGEDEEEDDYYQNKERSKPYRVWE